MPKGEGGGEGGGAQRPKHIFLSQIFQPEGRCRREGRRREREGGTWANIFSGHFFQPGGGREGWREALARTVWPERCGAPKGGPNGGGGPTFRASLPPQYSLPEGGRIMITNNFGLSDEAKLWPK